MKNCSCVCVQPRRKLLSHRIERPEYKNMECSERLVVAYIRKHSGNIYDLQYHPNTRYLASASDDKTIRLWDVDQKELVKTYAGHQGAVMDIAFSPDGFFLYSAHRRHCYHLGGSNRPEALQLCRTYRKCQCPGSEFRWNDGSHRRRRWKGDFMEIGSCDCSRHLL